MKDPDYALEVPITVRYHQDEVDQIIRCVEEGVYCAVLGPRLCGKTVLLRYVERILTKSQGWTCLYIDLTETNVPTQADFFADLIHQSARGLRQQAGLEMPQPEPTCCWPQGSGSPT